MFSVTFASRQRTLASGKTRRRADNQTAGSAVSIPRIEVIGSAGGGGLNIFVWEKKKLDMLTRLTLKGRYLCRFR
jgi:hypothetical protein